MIARHFGTLWYVAWFAMALALGYVVARSGGSDERQWIGAALAVACGLFFAWLAKLGRRLSQERYTVRVELHEFRFTWLWTMIWFGGALIGGWALAEELWVDYMQDGTIMLLGAGGILAGGWFARMAGRKHEHLRVDLAAGVAEYVGATKTVACPLPDIGRWDVVTYKQRLTHRHRTELADWYKLVAPGFPGITFADMPYPDGMRRLQAKLQAELDALRDIAAVRRVLADTPTDGANLRAGPALRDAVRAVVADPQPALRALLRDPDAEIRHKAHSLYAAQR